MCLLTFQKMQEKQNILFDEFFVTFNSIEVISFNYNAKGDALCLCDGTLLSLDMNRLDKIIFGVHRISLENYLKSIFDPHYQSDEIHRTGEELIFKSPELNKLKKYDLFNLAKKTLKEFVDQECEMFHYFEEVKQTTCTKEGCASDSQAEALYGNVNSKILHRKSCKSFNPTTCTSSFDTAEEAKTAGYKPCRQCKP